MQMSDKPEKKAKCNICARGLMGIEVSQGGLLCVFCAGGKSTISWNSYRAHAQADWEIYWLMRALLARYGKQTAHEKLSAITGVLGFIDISYVEKIEDKKGVIRELERMLQKGKRSTKPGRHQKRRKQ